MEARVSTYGRIQRSRLHAAMPSSTVSGYMAIRWNQHSRHGSRCSISDR